jgi:phosphoribosylanthranilate isomerase
LLDAPHSGQYGGTGHTTDWTLAQTAAKSHRILLAGGLTPDNVADAILAVRPYAVDVTSGVETKRGEKDPAKVRAFFEAVTARIAALPVAIDLLATESATEPTRSTIKG